MQIEAVQAKFRNGAHSYSFSPNGHQLNVGDYVIVDTEKGRDIVRITMPVILWLFLPLLILMLRTEPSLNFKTMNRLVKR